MDLRDGPEEAAFRATLRTWLEAKVPSGLRGFRGWTGPAEVAVVGDHDAIGEQLLRLAEAGATDFNAAPYALGEHDARLDTCLRALVEIGARLSAPLPLSVERSS